MRHTAFLATLLVVAAGCDTTSGDGLVTYSATLSPLNGSGASGTALIEADFGGGVFSVAVSASGLDDRSHPQFLFARPGVGSECPTVADDANADGVVDVVEATAATGGILLPFDNDISTQDVNVAGFPQSGSTVDYFTSTAMRDVQTALLRDDPDAADLTVTLGADASLFLEDFVVVLHGTSGAVPGTAQSVLGLDAATTLPVACGVLTVQN
jgi:hypothetical protein